jgi:hypothetical protein
MKTLNKYTLSKDDERGDWKLTKDGTNRDSLGLPIETVRTRVRRALERLRTAFAADRPRA